MLSIQEIKSKYNSGIVYIIFLLVVVILGDRLIYNSCIHKKEMIYPDLVIGCISALVTLVTGILIKRNENKPEKAKRNWRDKVRLVVSNSCSGSILDILTVVSFLAFMAWIPDSISDFIKNEEEGGWWYLARTSLYIIGLFLMIYGKPSSYKIRSQIKPEVRKVLVTGMSNLAINEKNRNNNLDPIIKPLLKYKKIEKIGILLSDDILQGLDLLSEKLNGLNKEKSPKLQAMYEYCETFRRKEGVEKDDNLYVKLIVEGNECKLDLVKGAIRKLITTLIHIDYPDYPIPAIEFSDPVDYDNFDACNKACFNLIRNVMDTCNYEDKEIVVFTTPGTKMVTSALTINAIKGEREMVYLHQKNSQGSKPEDEIVICNPDVTLIQFNGWMKDMEDR